MLILSHAHADHLNGLPRLRTGLTVDTIMLPLLSVKDRLIAFARSLAEAPALFRDSFYREFIADPATALARLEPRQILFVKRGTRGEGAPGSDGGGIEPFVEGGTVGDSPLRDGADGERWRLIGRGRVENHRTAPSRGSGKSPTAAVKTIPDSRAIAVNVRGYTDLWLLAPHVNPGIEASRRSFFRALSGHHGFDEKSLANPRKLREILKDQKNHKILEGAYRAVRSNPNVTSLCLYSGPAQNLPNGGFSWRMYRNSEGKICRCCGQIAWLGTGDAVLNTKPRVAALDAHYGVHLGNVGTMTLPHHGSDKNADGKLLDKVDPTHCVASAGHSSKWVHPGKCIRQAAKSRGIRLTVVTNRTSHFRKTVLVL